MASTAQPPPNLQSDCYVLLENGTKLPVHAPTLAAVSDTLAKTFTFEDQKSISAEAPIREITSLQEYNSEVVAFVLSALQGRISAVDVPSIRLLKHSCLMVEKFNCSHALVKLSAQWIRLLREKAEQHQWMGVPIGGHKLAAYDLIGIAYFFDNPEEFFNITQDLTMYHRGSFCDVSAMMEVVPPTVFLTMAERKRRVHRKLTFELNQAMNNFMSSASLRGTACVGHLPQGVDLPKGVNCGFHYLSKMSQNFFPRRRESYRIDDELFLLCDRALAQHSLSAFLTGHLCKGCKVKSAPFFYNLLDECTEIGEDCWDMIMGVCLDCVRTRGTSYPDCRVEHEKDDIFLGLAQPPTPHPFRFRRCELPYLLPHDGSSRGQVREAAVDTPLAITDGKCCEAEDEAALSGDEQ